MHENAPCNCYLYHLKSSKWVFDFVGPNVVYSSQAKNWRRVEMSFQPQQSNNNRWSFAGPLTTSAWMLAKLLARVTRSRSSDVAVQFSVYGGSRRRRLHLLTPFLFLQAPHQHRTGKDFVLEQNEDRTTSVCKSGNLTTLKCNVCLE